MISIDPGVKYYARADWDEHGTLKALGMCHLEDQFMPGMQTVVLEKPQVYKHSRVRNEDIVDLAMAAMYVASQVHGRVVWYLPREWKQQLPKRVHHVRIVEALMPKERTLLQCWRKGELIHLLDAIGLGLYHTGRLRP